MNLLVRRIIAFAIALALTVVTGPMPAMAAHGAAAGPSCMSMPMASDTASRDHRQPPGHHRMTGISCGDCCVALPPLVAAPRLARAITPLHRPEILVPLTPRAVTPPLPPPRA